MISLFLTRNNFNYKSRTPASINNTYGRIYLYLRSVIDWFRKSNYFVKNENVLVQMITTIGINPTWDIPTIIKYTENNIRNITRTLGVSNEYYIDILPSNSGIINNTTEILFLNNKSNLYTTKDIDKKNWFLLQPFTFRNHDFTDLYFNHPDRIIDGDGSIVVYELDAILLMIMYKFYVEDRIEKNVSYSTAEFIGAYVLTNSIYSLADVAILNNYLDKGNIELKPKQYVSTTMVPMNSTRLDRIVDTSILMDDRQSLMEVLRNIILINKKDSYEFLFMENFYETSRSKIYLVLTLLDFIRNILKYIDADERDNGGYLKILLYEVNVFKNSNIYTGNSVVDKKIKEIISDIIYRLRREDDK